ncbi:MAG: AMP-binding protein [Myxococcales bacterium]|nr:AMP-binding protein [Myxococcales bacterium]
MLHEIAREKPRELALDDLSVQRTWAELSDRAMRIAHLLRIEFGLEAGDHAAFLLRNRVECIELLWGAAYAGVWMTPINWHLAAAEIDYVVEDSGAKVLFTEERYREVAERADCPSIEAGYDLDAALAASRSEPMPMDGPAAGAMIYTSGTTGLPKGVKRHQHATLADWLRAAQGAGRTVRLDGSGVHLATGPLYHAAPLMLSIYDQANGAPVVIMPAWDEEHCLALLEERGVAHTHLVPTMFVRLLALPDARRAAFDASSLRVVLHGAAPVSVPVKQRMIEWWGEVLVEYWGGTEGGVNSLIDSAEWLEHPGSVGRVVAGFDVFAVDDAGNRLPPGEEGVLYCHNQELDAPFHYHGDPEKTAKAFLAPGIFTLGDIGFVDADDYVYLRDRASNMIISGGVNIYPAEIEKVLLEHSAVADVAVFGIPNDEWGESVKAAVELTDGHRASESLAAEILAYAAGHMARYKVPRSIDFEAELPRHPSGKLYVRRLRDRYWQGRERRI